MANLVSSFQQVRSRRGSQMGLNGLIWVLWLWLYWPVFAYLDVIFQREDFRTNQLLLFGVCGLIVWQMRQEGVRPRFDSAPSLRRLPLLLALGGSLAYLLVERFLDINMLSACLFTLASYGLLGLWLSPARWRRGLPAMLLLIGVLPFGEHLQTFVGYPMRILTAELVRQGLTAMGVTSVGVDTILMFENGVSQVDLPCSGVKSLWTGMMFLLAATWVEGRPEAASGSPLTPRWLLVLLVFIPMLFVANLARVAILVMVGQVMGWQLLAEMLHVPLGVLGFVVVCGTAVWLLRWLTPGGKRSGDWEIRDAPISQSLNLSFTLILAVLVMILLYSPRPQTGLSGQPPAWKLPAALQTEPLPLKPDENEWLTRDGAESAERLRFQWGELSGSMILITSKTWRAHHRPERCFEVYGLTLDNSQAHLVTPNFPIRLVSLSDGDQHNQRTAVYWFQSATRVTDDYGTRIWADVSLERERWVLVSVLFDGVVEPNEAQTEALYVALHDSVEGYLK